LSGDSRGPARALHPVLRGVGHVRTGRRVGIAPAASRERRARRPWSQAEPAKSRLSLGVEREPSFILRPLSCNLQHGIYVTGHRFRCVFDGLRIPRATRLPARRDACACLPHAPGHLVSSHVFAPMSACLVYGCPARLHSHASAMCDARPRASVPPRSRLLRGLLRSPCACVLSCASLPLARHLPQPQRCVARPPTRRLRDADERGPHFRPRRLCSHLRKARSDQDDQPATGHAGARWPLHPLLRYLL
jgi:hypothetical protein